MRRLITAVALVALGAVPLTMFAGPAGAQDSNGYSGGWTDPAPTAQSDGTMLAYLEAASALTGEASHPNGISGVSAVLVPDTNNPPPDGCDASMDQDVAAEQNGNAITFHVDATFPCNLRYQVKATVQANKSPGLTGSKPPPYQLPMVLAVAIPPAPVEHVDATLAVDGDNRSVTLDWPAGAEPDLLGYVVTRTAGGTTSTLGQVDAGDTTKFVDKHPPAGTSSRYAVTAVRNGPDDEVEQVPSDPTTVAVNVPAASTSANQGGGTESGLTTVVTGQPTRGRPDPGSLSSVRARGGSGRPSGPPTTLDTGFQETLPFQPGDPNAGSAPPPSGDDAAVALFDEDTSGSPLSDKHTMQLIAAGLVVLMFASMVLVVTRRAARDAY